MNQKVKRKHTNTDIKGNFNLGRNTSCSAYLMLRNGTLLMEESSCFLSSVTLRGYSSKARLENHTYIHTLKFPNGGEIFFCGDNHRIVRLEADHNKLIIHIQPGIDWKKFVDTPSIFPPVEVLEDIIAI